VGKYKNADLMSSFCDRILKKGGEKLSDEEVENTLEKARFVLWFGVWRFGVVSMMMGGGGVWCVEGTLVVPVMGGGALGLVCP
jgi:hypothetical protein